MTAPHLLIIAIVLTNVSVAHAYLEPGTASLVLQGLLAGALSAMALAKLYWHRLKQLVAQLLGRAPKAESAESSTDDPAAPPH